MIELRWKLGRANKGSPSVPRKLQYRTLFYPVRIASGDIVLQQKTAEESEWQDVPTAAEQSQEEKK